MIISSPKFLNGASNMELRPEFNPCGFSIHQIEAEWQEEIPPNPREEILHSFRDSVESFLAGIICKIHGTEEILVRNDSDFLRVWVMINEPDLEIEDRIYSEYITRLKCMPNFQIDLCVMYRMGRPSTEITPQGATLLYRA